MISDHSFDVTHASLTVNVRQSRKCEQLYHISFESYLYELAEQFR